MNSTDDFLDELRRKQAKEKESARQPSRMKEFFKRSSIRFLVAGIVAAIFSVLALTPGIGYTINVDIFSTRLLIEGHPCYGYICNGTMNATFNRFLYPVNHLFGSEISTEFSRLSGPWGYGLEESMTTEALVSEFPINIPFFYAVGFILVVGLEKAIRSGSPPR